METTTEKLNDEELLELNREMTRLLQGWRFEYGNNKKQVSNVNKRHSARDATAAFLGKHGDLGLLLEIRATEDNWKH